MNYSAIIVVAVAVVIAFAIYLAHTRIIAAVRNEVRSLRQSFNKTTINAATATETAVTDTAQAINHEIKAITPNN